MRYPPFMISNTPPFLKKTSRAIELLRFPLAVMVVFIHSYGQPKGFNLTELQTLPITATDICDYIRICLSLVLPNVAVPAFFLISGYLFFLNIDKLDYGVYKAKIKKRINTLFVPYVLWNIIAVLTTLLIKSIEAIKHQKNLMSIFLDFFDKNGYLHILWDSHLMNDSYPNWLMQNIRATAPYNVPLWFIRDLMVVMLISPVLYWLLKKTRGWILVLLTIFFVSDIWIHLHGLSIMCILFFSVGSFLSIHHKDLIEWVTKYRIISYIMSPILIVSLVYLGARNTTYGNWLNPVYIIIGTIALFNLAADAVGKGLKINKTLVASTFFIFVAHNFVIRNYCQMLCYKILPNNTVGYILGYFSSVTLCIIVCVFIYIGMRKFIPNTLSLLMGKR